MKPTAGNEKLSQWMDYLHLHLLYSWTTVWQKPDGGYEFHDSWVLHCLQKNASIFLLSSSAKNYNAWKNQAIRRCRFSQLSLVIFALHNLL